MNVYWLEQTEAEVPAENDWLSANEVVRLNGMRFAKRRNDWRLGRWTAKCALSLSLDLPAHLQVLKKIEIRPAPSGAPEVFFAINRRRSRFHSATAPVSRLVPWRCPAWRWVAIWKSIEARSDAFVADYFTDEEQALVASALRPTGLGFGAALEREGERAQSAAWRASPRHSVCDRYPFARHSTSMAGARCGFVTPAVVRRPSLPWLVATCDNMVRTVVADPPPDPPIPLRSRPTTSTVLAWRPIPC